MKQFSRLFALSSSTRIIDVGGSEMNWTLINDEPQVHLVNIDDEQWERGRFKKTKGDGRHLSFSDNSFDIAYSNSVIEHVGGLPDQIAFAHEIRRIARQYYVQTPNKYFFVEPHMVTPFIHFLPPRVLRKLVRTCSLWGLIYRPDQAAIDDLINSIRLLTRKEVQELFPDAEIIEERFLGMTKSFIAVRR